MAAGTAIYKRIIEVLEKWPIDKTKTGRDLGEFLREYMNTAYKTNKFEANHKFWDRQFIALEKLVNNRNRNKYKRTLTSSATGLTAEQCKLVLSNEFLEEFNNEKPFFKRLISFKSDPK